MFCYCMFLNCSPPLLFWGGGGYVANQIFYFFFFFVIHQHTCIKGHNKLKWDKGQNVYFSGLNVYCQHSVCSVCTNLIANYRCMGAVYLLYQLTKIRNNGKYKSIIMCMKPWNIINMHVFSIYAWK